MPRVRLLPRAMPAPTIAPMCTIGPSGPSAIPAPAHQPLSENSKKFAAQSEGETIGEGGEREGGREEYPRRRPG
jgi:hypothetical protein